MNPTTVPLNELQKQMEAEAKRKDVRRDRLLVLARDIELYSHFIHHSFARSERMIVRKIWKRKLEMIRSLYSRIERRDPAKNGAGIMENLWFNIIWRRLLAAPGAFAKDWGL